MGKGSKHDKLIDKFNIIHYFFIYLTGGLAFAKYTLGDLNQILMYVFIYSLLYSIVLVILTILFVFFVVMPPVLLSICFDIETKKFDKWFIILDKLNGILFLLSPFVVIVITTPAFSYLIENAKWLDNYKLMGHQKMDILFAFGIVLVPVVVSFLIWLFSRAINSKEEDEPLEVNEKPVGTVLLSREPVQSELPFHEEEKYCQKCQRVLPLSCFRKNSHTDDGLTKWCIECMNHRLPVPKHLKHCPKCNRNRRRSSFYKSSKNPDGLTKWCKSCLKEYSQAKRK